MNQLLKKGISLSFCVPQIIFERRGFIDDLYLKKELTHRHKPRFVKCIRPYRAIEKIQGKRKIKN